MNKKVGIITFFLAAVLAFSQETYSSWGYYKSLTVNTSANTTGANLTSGVGKFPLLVRLTSANSDVFTQATATASDVRFTKADGVTRLPHQRERWDVVNQVAEFWVLMDTVNAGDSTQSIRMYWGKSGVADSSSGPSVFQTSNGFVSVSHLGDSTGTNPRPNAVSGAPVTVVRNPPVGYGPVKGAIGTADSLVGGTGDAVGAGNYLDIGRTGYAGFSNFATAGISFSIWVKTDNASNFERYLHMDKDTLNASSVDRLIVMKNGTTPANGISTRFGTNSTNGTTGLSTGAWMHIFMTKPNGSAAESLYINGTFNFAATGVANFGTSTHPIVWFGRSTDATNAYVKGVFDEPVFANQNRSRHWVLLSYQTQKPGATAVSLGASVSLKTVPDAPTAATATAGNAQATISWTAPSSDGGSTITGYTVTTVQDTSKHCLTTGSLTCNVTGLANNTAYTFTVTASNSVGTSAASAASNSVTPTAPSGAPNPPTGVTATAGNGTATVSWIASTTNGSAVTTYVVTSSPDGKSCTTTGLTCVDSALTNGTSYTFAVVANSSVGSSAASSASNAVTPVGVPGAPTGVTGAAGNALVTVSWTAPSSNGGSAITGYKAAAVSDTTKSCTTTGALTCVVSGLTNGTSYTFTVKATNIAGSGAASSASVGVTPATAPGAPTAVSAKSGGNGADSVSWTAPSSNGGSAITGYVVTAVQDTARHCTTTGAAACVVTGLTNTTAYSFTVVAVNAVGAGAASSASNTATSIWLGTKLNMRLAGSGMSLQLPEFSGVAVVSVMDVWGRVVWNRTIASGAREISLQGSHRPSPGVYIVRLKIQESGKWKLADETKIMFTP